MSTNLCDTSALSNLLSALNGSSTNALSELSTVAAIATEARSVAVAANSESYGTASGSSSGSVLSGNTVTGAMIQGLRNRLFLKYAAIDYEFYNIYDLQYRTTV